MKVLVTGGGGFIGSRLVKQLLQQGDKVSSFSRNHYPMLKLIDVTQIQGDLKNAAQVSAACQDVDIVYHVAAAVDSWGSYEDLYNSNVIGTENVIAACQKWGVKKLVYTSTPSVVAGSGHLRSADESLPYPEKTLNHYQKTKIIAEQRVLAANSQDGLATTAIRPHFVWGPGDQHILPRLFERLAEGRLRILGDGCNRVGITYVDNAAWAHVLAAKSTATNGKAYFINEEEPVTLWAWLNAMFSAVGLPQVNNSVPYVLAYSLGALLEVLHTALPLRSPPRLTRYLVDTFALDHYFSIKRAQQDFGYKPLISPSVGFDKTADYYRSGLISTKPLIFIGDAH